METKLLKTQQLPFLRESLDVGCQCCVVFDLKSPPAGSYILPIRKQNGSLRGAKFQKMCLRSLRGFIPTQFFKLFKRRLVGKCKGQPIGNETRARWLHTREQHANIQDLEVSKFAYCSLTSRPTQAYAIFTDDFRIHQAILDVSVCGPYAWSHKEVLTKNIAYGLPTAMRLALCAHACLRPQGKWLHLPFPTSTY